METISLIHLVFVIREEKQIDVVNISPIFHFCPANKAAPISHARSCERLLTDGGQRF